MSQPDQKVAIITGGSHGIGPAWSPGTGSGAGGRGHLPHDQARQRPGLLTVDGDVADPATADRIIGQALERFGRIDTLVNNAGVFLSKPFTDYTADDYAPVVSVNLTGFFWLTQRAIAEMLKRGRGHVVNITTTLVDYASSSSPLVLTALTKGGLAAATRSLAIEYASQGIRVNAVSPGIIQTPRIRRRARGARPSSSPSGAWARSATSSTASSSWSHRRSSPARSCTSTAARSPATDLTSGPRSPDGRLDIVVDADGGQQPVRPALVDPESRLGR